MKILEGADHSDILESLINQQVVGDYIYMYPPRQAYQFIDADFAIELAKRSLDKSDKLNLYFHVPFCKQICSFCNLYAKVLTGKDDVSYYIDLIIRELELYGDSLKNKKTDTLYLGGGTPSLLEAKEFEKLFRFLEVNNIASVAAIPEVAIEAAPDTVVLEKFMDYRSIGINRVNLGFQTMTNDELKGIGRRHGFDVLDNAIKTIKQVGFSNVCIDLIYGLQYQSFDSWVISVKMVIDYNPETICVYPLTLRESTSYERRGYLQIAGEEQYLKYDVAVSMLLEAGYHQETHIRFMKANGGYLQKANHWRLENILGIGAGARSYLWDIDTRNGYSAVNRSLAFNDYVEKIEKGEVPITDGFVMSPEERRRKALILNLIYLDRGWFRSLFDIDPLTCFPRLKELEQMSLVTIEADSISLTPKGLKYRDLIVQGFFSKDVLQLIDEYDYAQ